MGSSTKMLCTNWVRSIQHEDTFQFKKKIHARFPHSQSLVYSRTSFCSAVGLLTWAPIVEKRKIGGMQIVDPTGKQLQPHSSHDTSGVCSPKHTSLWPKGLSATLRLRRMKGAHGCAWCVVFGADLNVDCRMKQQRANKVRVDVTMFKITSSECWQRLKSSQPHQDPSVDEATAGQVSI